MKVYASGYAASQAAGTKRRCLCLLITRTDGFSVGLTSADVDVTIPASVAKIGGVRYLSDPGLMDANIVQTSGLNVDNLEVEFLKDDAYVTRIDVLTGKWRKAAFRLFRCDPLAPADGQDTLMFGHLGDIQIMPTGYKAELRSILQLMQQQTLGEVTTPTCRARLGDARCKVDIGPYTVTGSITSVTSAQVVSDSTRAEAADYFGEGELTFTSGDLSGLTLKVRDFSAGQFTFAVVPLLSPEVGDTYTAVAGCRKRFTEDCVGKFDNALNFRGEPHLPGIDALTKPVEPSV